MCTGLEPAAAAAVAGGTTAAAVPVATGVGVGTATATGVGATTAAAETIGAATAMAEAAPVVGGATGLTGGTGATVLEGGSLLGGEIGASTGNFLTSAKDAYGAFMNMPLGQTTSLGTGITPGAGGVGFQAPGSGLLGGEMVGGGNQFIAALPEMGGGTGLSASVAPTADLSAPFMQAAAPSEFTTSFTMKDGLARLGKAGDYMGKVNAVTKAFEPQQQAPMVAGGPGPFEGRPMRSFAEAGGLLGPSKKSDFADYLKKRRMQGLLG